MTKFNLDVAPKICLVAKEGGNVGRVILGRDFKKAALAAGMLALYITPVVSTQLKLGPIPQRARIMLRSKVTALSVSTVH